MSSGVEALPRRPRLRLAVDNTATPDQAATLAETYSALAQSYVDRLPEAAAWQGLANIALHGLVAVGGSETATVIATSFIAKLRDPAGAT